MSALGRFRPFGNATSYDESGWKPQRDALLIATGGCRTAPFDNTSRSLRKGTGSHPGGRRTLKPKQPRWYRTLRAGHGLGQLRSARSIHRPPRQGDRVGDISLVMPISASLRRTASADPIFAAFRTMQPSFPATSKRAWAEAIRTDSTTRLGSGSRFVLVSRASTG